MKIVDKLADYITRAKKEKGQKLLPAVDLIKRLFS
jgi:hypothetical protein